MGERPGEIYYRLVEFQARLHRRSLERSLLYTAQILSQTGRPVAATVVLSGPGGPRSGDLTLRVVIGGREENR